MRQQYAKIADKRHQAFVEHMIADIVILTKCAVMCGIQTLEEISKQDINGGIWANPIG